MRVVIDVEADGLFKPTQIWVIVCKDIDTGERYIFRHVTKQDGSKSDFLTFSGNVSLFVGHNVLGYDYIVLRDLLDIDISDRCLDTLVISKLVNYSRKGHSIEHYGEEFGIAKVKPSSSDFFRKWSQELEERCVGDVDICHRIYLKYKRIIDDPKWNPAIDLEQAFQLVVNRIHDNGFHFDTKRASLLHQKVTGELDVLDSSISTAFPAKLKPIKEILPRYTRHGTLNKSDFRWVTDGDLSGFSGGPFTRCRWESFNPSSHKQIIDVLHQAGWKPTDRTKTYIDTEREINRLRYSEEGTEVDVENLSVRLVGLEKYGWKINEENLSTLPPSAPPPARLLAKRILLESRRRTLVEWLGLVQDDGRIHGRFYGIGAWTHRMAHQQPNTANIPNEFNSETGAKKLLGKELRSCWRAPRNRLLVGVDAEGIQLRIFAHYVNDPELTHALVRGRKSDKTDPHSVNQRVLGDICKTRQAAKRFLYALFLGGGAARLASILGCTLSEVKEALARIDRKYPGFAHLKGKVIPADAKRGFFIGLDGRKVIIPGDTYGERRHLCMSGYLQNGEAVVMKRATLKWEGRLKEYDSLLVDLVHDEWQTETPNDMTIAVAVAKMMSDSLETVGIELGLNCPLAGSYYNDDAKDYTIGVNWSMTH